MEYRILGRSDLGVSRIGLGTRAFGGEYGTVQKREVLRTIRHAVANGVTLFHSSPSFGNGSAESLLAEGLGTDSDTAILALSIDETPTPPSVTHTRPLADVVHDSLRRLRRDYIDLLIIHHSSSEDQLAGSLEAVDLLRRTRSIRFFGVAGSSPSGLRDIMNTARPEGILESYHVLNRSLERELLPFCRAAKIGVLAVEPFCRGLLLGKFHKNSVFDEDDHRVLDRRFRGERFRQNIETVNRLRSLGYQQNMSLMQLALGWIVQNDAVAGILCGAKTTDQLDAILKTAGTELTPEQVNAINQIVGEDRFQQPDDRSPALSTSNS